MPERYRTFAIAAACAGIASLIVGAFALANMGDHLATLDTRSASSAGRAFLIAGELTATISFSLAALVCLGLGERPGPRRLAASIAAGLKLATLVALLAGYWRLWYFMLDMRGPDGLALPVIILSGLQAAFLILMVFVSAGRTRP
ncbi:MAG: hypothetical protein OEQ29_03440 [Alphaproteobacteria bacterium]|nr:hypothetical protein [Alphaproteobacteria bacterium]